MHKFSFKYVSLFLSFSFSFFLSFSLFFCALLFGDLKLSPPFLLQNRPVVCSTNRMDECSCPGVTFRVRQQSHVMSVNQPAYTTVTSHVAHSSSIRTRIAAYSALMILTPYLRDWDPRVHKGDISMSEDPVLRVRILMPM